MNNDEQSMQSKKDYKYINYTYSDHHSHEDTWFCFLIVHNYMQLLQTSLLKPYMGTL